MEMHNISNGAAVFESLMCSLVAETAILAHKSLLLLLSLVWSRPNNNNVFPNSVRTDQRFPTSELTKVTDPDAENNDAGEAEDDDDDDDEDEDEDSDDNDEDDGNDSDEDSDDDDEDSDDEVEANGYDDSSDDSSDNDDEDDDSDDDGDEDDDEDEEEDEEEEQFRLPSQRKK